MKAVRIGVLTMVLMVAATFGAAPSDDTFSNDARTTSEGADGPCYLINGVWVCDPS